MHICIYASWIPKHKHLGLPDPPHLGLSPKFYHFFSASLILILTPVHCTRLPISIRIPRDHYLICGNTNLDNMSFLVATKVTLFKSKYLQLLLRCILYMTYSIIRLNVVFCTFCFLFHQIAILKVYHFCTSTSDAFEIEPRKVSSFLPAEHGD